MPICNKIQIKKREVCIGDLDKLISVTVRNINSPLDDGDVDYFTTLTDPVTLWAAIDTTPGETIFDGSNIGTDVTHRFYVRYIPDITFERMVTFLGRNYRILDVENLDGRNEFYLLRCTVRGVNTLPVNLA